MPVTCFLAAGLPKVDYGTGLFKIYKVEIKDAHRKRQPLPNPKACNPMPMAIQPPTITANASTAIAAIRLTQILGYFVGRHFTQGIKGLGIRLAVHLRNIIVHGGSITIGQLADELR